MQRGWGTWSPFEREVPELPNAWEAYPVEQQCLERPYDYLPDLELVLELAGRCGGPILDLACGNGRLALALAKHGFPVVGLDINPYFVRRAREAAAAAGPEVEALIRFQVADARAFSFPERFGLIIMMDQAFKYLLRHDDHLDCLGCVREHLKEDGRFLVEHRCVLRLPEGGPGETYTFAWRGREWAGVDTYDPVQQVGVSAFQPLADPTAPPELDPCRDFTYQELSLLHRVVGLHLEEVIHDLDERGPAPPFFDAAMLLKRCEPWRPRQPQASISASAGPVSHPAGVCGLEQGKEIPTAGTGTPLSSGARQHEPRPKLEVSEGRQRPR